MDIFSNVCMQNSEIWRNGFDLNWKIYLNGIFTSNDSVNMDLELNWTLHTHDNFIWALAITMAYFRIMYLVISKPSCVDVYLIFSMYYLTSLNNTFVPLNSPGDPTECIPCFCLRLKTTMQSTISRNSVSWFFSKMDEFIMMEPQLYSVYLSGYDVLSNQLL